MCGFVGLLAASGIADEQATVRLVTEMRDRVAHRGPDDAGLWLDTTGGLALGFRRLSIVDLSAAGHQPMLSADGRWAVVLNGEIYNFAALRREIEEACGPRSWRGHSDTEVLVEAIALWGIEPTLARANGMFALAAWDRAERVLWLARDRIGKKPLYYGWSGDTFVFGSELKALWIHPGFDFSISTDALAAYLQLGYVPGTRSIFEAISKLRHGHTLRLDAAQLTPGGDLPSPTPYWSLYDVAVDGLAAQEAGRAASTEELEAVLRDAVSLRMVADVPVGTFLSGGIDSSLVTALMAATAPGEVHSFSIGFETEQWNEATHAKAVAKHLGTRHEETYVSSTEAMAVIEDLPTIYDEPFADDSMIPTALLCRMARRSVTVALSGDGGDELFVGYDRYPDVSRLIARRDALPGSVRRMLGAVTSHVAQPLAQRWTSKRLERRARLLGMLLADGQPENFNEAVMSQAIDPGDLMIAPSVPRHPLTDTNPNLGRSNAIDRLTFMDTGSYLIDDILVKVDRASMAASLEVRCPLLDYRLIELSWRFPTAAKIQGGVGKLPLRSVLHRHVPQALVERPKQGFCAPVEIWVRHELRAWGEALMTSEALGRHGLLNVAECRRTWESFAVHDRGWDPVIWRLLMFQAWYARMAATAAPGIKRSLPSLGLEAEGQWRSLETSIPGTTSPPSKQPVDACARDVPEPMRTSEQARLYAP
jgi:asparagine synthase (glutamine-hydrolysing)